MRRPSVPAGMRSQKGVDVPEDLARALRADPALLAAFERMPPSHQREYVAWVEEAKRPETRARRIAQAAERVRAG
jgi:uncharacterized protein YdeI (YjbR/CyaY-like superfamily)